MHLLTKRSPKQWPSFHCLTSSLPSTLLSTLKRRKRECVTQLRCRRPKGTTWRRTQLHCMALWRPSASCQTRIDASTPSCNGITRQDPCQTHSVHSRDIPIDPWAAEAGPGGAARRSQARKHLQCRWKPRMPSRAELAPPRAEGAPNYSLSQSHDGRARLAAARIGHLPVNRLIARLPPQRSRHSSSLQRAVRLGQCATAS